ncbi:MAG: hypothetical protein KF810_16875 [Rhizobiaceae bacterium]|nr:hypothetical protein [Rhizobiaceae bacterium]
MAEDDKELFDSAFEEQAIDTPAPEQAPAQPRDEHGRFAAKAQEQEQSALDEDQEQAPVQQQEPEQKPQGIPSWRLKEEAEAKRAAEERALAAERRMAELERRIEEMGRKPEPEKPTPEIWDDPRAFVQAEISPIQTQMQSAIQQLAKETAIVRHTEAVVTEAERAFMQSMADRTLDPADYNRVVNSQNRYSAAVEWYKRSQTLQKVGNDPEAWLEAEMERRLADPEYQAKVMERIRGTAQQQRPVTQLPPSLNKMTRAGGHPDGDDESDAGLLKSALRR